MQISLKNHNKQAKKRLAKNPVPSALLYTAGQDLKALEGHSYARLAFPLFFQSPFLTEKLPHASRFGVSLFFNL